MLKKNNDRVREARKAAGISIAQLHEKTGISVGQISMYENGKTELSGEKLISICRTLNLSLDATATITPPEDPITALINQELAKMDRAKLAETLSYLISKNG